MGQRNETGAEWGSGMRPVQGSLAYLLESGEGDPRYDLVGEAREPDLQDLQQRAESNELPWPDRRR